jgi:hypothetical protein
MRGRVMEEQLVETWDIKAVVAGDVAQLYTDGHGTAAGVEVLRRQPDGTWLLVRGDPNGRG